MSTELLELAESLKRQARVQVMDFWLANGIDAEYGGYWTDLDRTGQRYGDGAKWIIVQARTIYSMCIAHQFFDEPIFLEQAAQGAAFFREHFRDRRRGGWHYGVSRDGAQVLDDSKQPYGLAFASYALAEYARLSGDREALQDAVESHELAWEKCWDKQYGGLPNRFSADWQLVEPIKRVDTHMHTMEAVSALYHATGEDRFVARLNQLADTILGRVDVDGCYDAAHGCTLEQFYPNWREASERTNGLCNYGHVTEAGWFIAKLAAYTGDACHARLARGLVDWAIRYGFDRSRGGLFDLGKPTGEAADRRKTWWNQAELLGALAFFYRLTGDGEYLARLRAHVHFIEHWQLDSEFGEWYPTLYEDGSIFMLGGVAQDHKGSRWKSPYHVIQGLYHAWRDLQRAAGAVAVADPPRWDDCCL